MTLTDAILWAENWQLLHCGEPQGRVTAQAIRLVQIKCHRLDLPREWVESITKAVAIGYPPEGRARRPGTWRQ